MRRCKLAVLLVIITLTNTAGLFAAGKKSPEIKLPLLSNKTKMKKERVKATFGRRRLIFNDDTHGMGMFVIDTKKKFLSRRMKPLLGTQTTTVSWSVLGGWADAPMYDSKIQPVYGDAHGGVPPYYPKFTSNLKALIKAGHCPLQMVIDFTHENEMETFVHVRMNDCHDSFIGGGRTLWKRAHQELMVDTKGVLPDLQLYTSAQDFTHKEVRRRKLEIIEEVCTRYDIDGFELDFIRHPAFFSRTLRGLPATKEQIEIMTSLMQQIRQLTEKVAAGRDRPLLIAVRIPDTFEQSLDIGLDIVKWMQDDLFDILIPSGYSPFTVDIKDLVEKAHKYEIAVYPCNNFASVNHPSKDNHLQLSRATASNWYLAGADGIHTFNVGTAFDSKVGKELIELQKKQYAFLYEVGDPDTLLGKDKIFAVDPEKERALVYYKHISSMSPLP
ncbi:MAG: glycoside hydrolase family 10 protein, partial [Planctomycetota bacterium]